MPHNPPGGRIASKLLTPNMPRLLMVKLPLLYSSGASCLARARFTRSAQLRDIWYISVLSASCNIHAHRHHCHRHHHHRHQNRYQHHHNSLSLWLRTMHITTLLSGSDVTCYPPVGPLTNPLPTYHHHNQHRYHHHNKLACWLLSLYWRAFALECALSQSSLLECCKLIKLTQNYLYILQNHYQQQRLQLPHLL